MKVKQLTTWLDLPEDLAACTCRETLRYIIFFLKKILVLKKY